SKRQAAFCCLPFAIFSFRHNDYADIPVCGHQVLAEFADILIIHNYEGRQMQYHSRIRALKN
ncbi:MAG: hypothetical protein II661_04945, partial [Bacteroidales bacterium]|nr:hypothetical protein [Bacteroidales bacterium]